MNEQIDKELEKLPEEFRSMVYSQAWDRGHSSGEDEVYNYIIDLVYDLLQPIQKYTERINGIK